MFRFGFIDLKDSRIKDFDFFPLSETSQRQLVELDGLRKSDLAKATGENIWVY